MWFAFPEGVYVVCTRRLYGFPIQIVLTAVKNGVKVVVQTGNHDSGCTRPKEVAVLDKKIRF